MPKIKWVGLQKWSKEYPDEPLPNEAVVISYPENNIRSSLKYGILPMLLCFLALYVKQKIYHEFPLNRSLAIAGILLGLILIPVHEYLHAVSFPKNSIVYLGLSPKRLAAFTVCHYPLSKKRFIMMSLLPVLLGIIPLLLFLLFPISWKIPSAICWPAAMIGFLSPMPDYMEVHLFGKQVPSNAYIQATNNGWYWFL